VKGNVHHTFPVGREPDLHGVLDPDIVFRDRSVINDLELGSRRLDERLEVANELFCRVCLNDLDPFGRIEAGETRNGLRRIGFFFLEAAAPPRFERDLHLDR